MSTPDDDKELEEFLAGTSPVSRAYRARADAEPPGEIDAAVLAAAREAVGTQPRSTRYGWPYAIGIAATLVLGVALVLQIAVEPTGPLPSGPPPGVRFESVAPSTPAAADGRAQQIEPSRLRQKTLAETAPATELENLRDDIGMPSEAMPDSLSAGRLPVEVPAAPVRSPNIARYAPLDPVRLEAAVTVARNFQGARTSGQESNSPAPTARRFSAGSEVAGLTESIDADTLSREGLDKVPGETTDGESQRLEAKSDAAGGSLQAAKTAPGDRDVARMLEQYDAGDYAGAWTTLQSLRTSNPEHPVISAIDSGTQ